MPTTYISRNANYTRNDYRAWTDPNQSTYNHPASAWTYAATTMGKETTVRRRKSASRATSVAIPKGNADGTVIQLTAGSLIPTRYARYNYVSTTPKGEMFLTPIGWTYWTRQVGDLNNSGFHLLHTNGYLVSDALLGPNMPSINLTCRSVAENELLSQVKAQKLNLAVSVAEAKQTVGWIAGRAQDLASMADGLLKNNYKRFRRAHDKALTRPVPRHIKTATAGVTVRDTAKGFTGNLANRWLEYNYAFIPLMLDVYGSAEALAYMLNAGSDVLMEAVLDKPVARVTDTAESSIWKAYSSHLSNNSVPWAFSGRVVQYYDSAITYKVSQAYLANLAGLGVTNPAEVLWEKTKFSFLIDWLIPVGDFLSGWDAPVGATFVHGWYTVMLKANLTGRPIKTSTGYATVKEPPVIYYKGFYRKPLFTFPYPSLYVKNPLSGSHVATALALIRNLF